ncbi:arsenate reductase [Roseivivax halotolerans]|jgi:arsenate reductase-like glutaredoxin family protein|uniref:Arsenate reductase n=1 Tax=Roseivivax halotolerans TaxID=93684 RepID=A0A1I5XUA7_9RHOB|nr:MULTISPECIES: ArsC/Spx/MgsR family protein [Roseivivax]QFT62325.1 putative reductase [Roseivivax sp. THAF30]SFQ35563.1 arsenate reductase [Roseivivax halotolerans]
MKIYGIKNCDTCKQAQKALPDAEFVDVREDGMPGEVLADALERFGDRMLNIQSKTYRELSEEDRKKQPVWIIGAHPAAMKRPLIVKGDEMYLGFGADTREALGV